MTIYITLLLEGLAVHAKLFRDPLVVRDRRLAQCWSRASHTFLITTMVVPRFDDPCCCRSCRLGETISVNCNCNVPIFHPPGDI
jgi:hypothetical protein